VVYGIVRQNGGRIKVTSEVGKGSEFRLCFPASSSTATDIREDDEVREPPRTKGKRILVVEQERAVRMYVRRVLKHSGYHVLSAVHHILAGTNNAGRSHRETWESQA